MVNSLKTYIKYGVNDGARTRDNWNHNPASKNKKSLNIKDLICFLLPNPAINILCFMMEC